MWHLLFVKITVGNAWHSSLLSLSDIICLPSLIHEIPSSEIACPILYTLAVSSTGFSIHLVPKIYHICNVFLYRQTKASPTKKGSCNEDDSTGPSPTLLKVKPLSLLTAKPIDVSTDTETLLLQPQVYAKILSPSLNTLIGKIPC